MLVLQHMQRGWMGAGLKKGQVSAAQRRRNGVVGAALLGCCVLSSGCHHAAPPPSQDDQILATLNAFYAAQPACLWSEPVRIDGSRGGSHSPTLKESRALDDAGLIDRDRRRDTLTNAGRTFWHEDAKKPGFGNLCFGKWTVTRVVSVSPLQNDLFHNLYEARFEVAMPSPALWTRMPQMQAAFPLMGQKVSAPRPRSATMRKTDSGWQVAVIAES